MIKPTRGNFSNTDTLENNMLIGQVLILFMLRNVKCESAVEIVMGNESNVLSCNGNMFCLIAVNTVEIIFVNWFYYFVRF